MSSKNLSLKSIERQPLLPPNQQGINYSGISRKNLYFSYIEGTVIPLKSSYKDCCHKTIVFTILFFAAGLAFTGRIPFIKPAVDLAGKIKPLGYLFGFSAFTAFGSLSAWGLVNIVKEAIQPRTNEENQITKKQGNSLVKTIYFGTLALIGLASQFAMAYMAYHYNPEGGVVWPVVVLVADSGLPAYSMHLLLSDAAKQNRIIAKCQGGSHSIETKFIAEIKNALIHVLRNAQQNILLADAISQKSDLPSILGSSEERTTANEFLNRLVNHNNAAEQKLLPSVSKTQNVCRYIFMLVGGICATIGFLFIGKLSWAGAALLYDNLYFKIFIVIISTLPTAYVSIKVTAEGFGAIFSNLVNLLCCKGESIKSLASHFYPKITATIRVLALLAATFTFAAIVQVTKDYFGLNNALGITVAIASILNIVALTINSMLDLVGWILSPLIKAVGSREAREVGHMLDRIEKLIKIIDSGNEENFKIFLEELDNNIIERLKLSKESKEYTEQIRSNSVTSEVIE